MPVLVVVHKVCGEYRQAECTSACAEEDDKPEESNEFFHLQKAFI
ncbi:MAG: hypothetical protein ACYSSP_10110 [Planctomycetota bacterium]